MRLILAAILILARPSASNAGQSQSKPPDSIDDTLEAGEAEAEEPRRKLIRWNEYEGPFFTIRLGAGVLYDFATYAQDDASRQQFDLDAAAKPRDARLLLKGRLKFRRGVTWSAGFMYDGATDCLKGPSSSPEHPMSVNETAISDVADSNH